MTPYESAEWTEIFVASAGAAAALTGLVFVAVSINVERILKYEGLPERALATLILLLGVVIVSLIGLAPGQGPVALGVELLGTGLLGATATTRLILRPQSDAEGSQTRGANVVLMATGTLPFVVGGASVILGGGGGLYWVLAGMVFALVGAVLNAWVFLVEILR
jgi:hypothetical protein